uniref:Uncharacterized protein n=1 Tax=Anguilla anguilla TaxID=7936 RepID=A0A0E9UXN5_ANGAN
MSNLSTFDSQAVCQIQYSILPRIPYTATSTDVV